MCTGTPRSDIVGHIPRKISRNDGATYRTLLYNDRVLEMTLGLFYVLLSTSTKIFAGTNFRESVQTRAKTRKFAPREINRLYGNMSGSSSSFDPRAQCARNKPYKL